MNGRFLQILINLISNAKYALNEVANRQDKNIIIRSEKRDSNFVLIEVTDNGRGIDKENINRLFQYGFTTRKDGHGFGLHNAALIARELGGELTVKSDGIGKGATFSLMIPLRFS